MIWNGRSSMGIFLQNSPSFCSQRRLHSSSNRDVSGLKSKIHFQYVKKRVTRSSCGSAAKRLCVCASSEACRNSTSNSTSSAHG